MKTIEKQVYTFDELTESAKESARNSWRCEGMDYDWFDAIYDDATQIADILGITLKQITHNTSSGKIVHSPAIYFSGFCSQGDGACFEGSWRYSKDCVKKIKAYTPKDTELHRIATVLADCGKRSFYTAFASIKHSGHYYHSGCMDIECEQEKGKDVSEDVRMILREFAGWIYASLEKEYDYLTSDECIDEVLKINKYDFDENGKIV